MNRIRTLVPLIAAAILQTTPALIAEQPVLKADVPFQFSVEDRTLPAGTYRISREGAFLHIENVQHSNGYFAVMNSVGTLQSDQTRLVFDQVNGQYFLRELEASSSGNSIELAISRTEKKAMSLTRADARSPVNTQVTVAVGGR